ncbi:hypothetical protein BCAR13_1060054 [Paraburkholderia caribensis]|nr:hypothetical protein BCAR13_1060054 [Paraburkholderia caribensis]
MPKQSERIGFRNPGPPHYRAEAQLNERAVIHGWRQRIC